MLLLFAIGYAFAGGQKAKTSIGVDATIDLIKTNATLFTASLQNLKKEIEESQSSSRQKQQNALAQSRVAYKRIEFFVDYFFSRTSNVFNRPLGYEVETPFVEYDEPSGLQLIEDILFNEKTLDKKRLLAQVDYLLRSAQNINAVLFTLHVSDEQVLESLRLELIRVAALGITGSDAPQLQTSIVESEVCLQTIEAVLKPYLRNESDAIKDRLEAALAHCESFLKTTSFNSFDRLTFLLNGLFPLQKNLSTLIDDLQLSLNTVPQINYSEANFFADDFFNKEAFIKPADKNLGLLGRQLFFDRRLSQNRKLSCASCHLPEKYFTDGRTKSTAFNGLPTRRNSPSLLYAVYQQSQFWDGRERSLENQVKAVLLRSTEMTGGAKNITTLVAADTGYQNLFKKCFGDSSLSVSKMATAIAAYESTLAPFTSPFDAFVKGNANALTIEQKKGFNLFTGKAGCATCHFLPLFNGLVPPTFKQTDFEIIGTPSTTNFSHAKLDSDSGQFHLLRLPFTVGAFKTPSLRNVAITAPYMHNGAFATLDQVIHFYDKGGGQGLGIRLSYQTLSNKPLHLASKEKKAIVAFLQSLTDKQLTINSEAKNNVTKAEPLRK